MEKETLLLIIYPKCSTCQKAKKFLITHHIPFEERHIIENTPTVEELKTWLKMADFPLTKLWNTGGQLYRAEKIKDRLPSMDETERLEMLASNGMFLKRPLLVGKKLFLVGFQESQWEALCKKL